MRMDNLLNAPETSSGSKRWTQAGPGFTLIELLIVIAIIGVLSVLLFVVFPSVRLRAESTTTVSNLRQIVLSMQAYAQDNNGNFPPPLPPSGNLNETYRLGVLYTSGYINDPKILINPTNKRQTNAIGRYGVFSENHCYFTARKAVDSKWGKVWGPVETPLNILSGNRVPIVWDQRCDQYGSSYNTIRTFDGRWGGHFAYPDGRVQLLGYPDEIIR